MRKEIWPLPGFYVSTIMEPLLGSGGSSDFLFYNNGTSTRFWAHLPLRGSGDLYEFCRWIRFVEEFF